MKKIHFLDLIQCAMLKLKHSVQVTEVTVSISLFLTFPVYSFFLFSLHNRLEATYRYSTNEIPGLVSNLVC